MSSHENRYCGCIRASTSHAVTDSGETFTCQNCGSVKHRFRHARPEIASLLNTAANHVEGLRGQGWQKKDFAKALGNMLGVEDEVC